MGGDESRENEPVKRDESDADIFELAIYNISPILGGRSEVMKAPFIECVKHLELELERKKTDRWNGFLDLFYSHPEMDQKKRQAYIKIIQPEKAKPKMTMKTDQNQLREIAEQQKKARERKVNSKK